MYHFNLTTFGLYRGENRSVGPQYLILKPFDSRLLPTIAVAVAKVETDFGLAQKPIDLVAYEQSLEAQVFKSLLLIYKHH